MGVPATQTSVDSLASRPRKSSSRGRCQETAKRRSRRCHKNHVFARRSIGVLDRASLPLLPGAAAAPAAPTLFGKVRDYLRTQVPSRVTLCPSHLKRWSTHALSAGNCEATSNTTPFPCRRPLQATYDFAVLTSSAFGKFVVHTASPSFKPTRTGRPNDPSLWGVTRITSVAAPLRGAPLHGSSGIS